MKTDIALAVVVSSTLAAAACQTPEQHGSLFGEELTLADTTLVSSILAEPESYVGRRVMITGTVVAVCENRGCWMDIASDVESEKIQVKVDDGVIVFPLSARGHRAIVEGVVEKLDLSVEQLIARGEHEAEEHGTEFDPASVTGPETIYRIRGVGARIEGQ